MNLDELSRRLVKCKHFQWMDGMLAISFQGDRRWAWRQNEQDDHLPESDSFPDLTDPATLGCLLHLVRKAHNEPFLGFASEPTGDDDEEDEDERWQPYGHLLWSDHLFDDDAPVFRTEAHVLVAALEAAP
jgi:hypothetical protein